MSDCKRTRTYLEMCQRIRRQIEEGDILFPSQKKLYDEWHDMEVVFLGRGGMRDFIYVKKEDSNTDEAI